MILDGTSPINWDLGNSRLPITAPWGEKGGGCSFPLSLEKKRKKKVIVKFLNNLPFSHNFKKDKDVLLI